jgi:hypothetical protein
VQSEDLACIGGKLQAPAENPSNEEFWGSFTPDDSL